MKKGPNSGGVNESVNKTAVRHLAEPKNNRTAVGFVPETQWSEGHVVIVPIRHVTHMRALSQREWDDLMELSRRTATKTIHSYYGWEDGEHQGASIILNQGRIAGQTEEHLLVHMVPRFDNPESM